MERRLLSLYRGLPYLDKRHIEIRFRHCPFEYIERLIPERGLIVDIGCGHGLFANLLALKSELRDVVGIDISSKKIDIAKATIGNRQNIHFICSRFEDLDFSPASAITMLDVMYLIPFKTQRTILQKIKRTLSEDGMLLMREVLRSDSIEFKKICLQEAIMVRILRRTMGETFYYRDLEGWRGSFKEVGLQIREEHLFKNGLIELFICQPQK